jgi:hypothetical protein
MQIAHMTTATAEATLEHHITIITTTTTLATTATTTAGPTNHTQSISTAIRAVTATLAATGKKDDSTIRLEKRSDF